ncbi:KAP family P-loop NTPase fold protein [Pararhizobium mangrovi]|uniref:KAP NTPase domain-containing protein n=1 Tax=Pararhizobium mangrovi TaxID=2590452 RepID=A0A506TXF7_9HYPH|nr:P-loop NTPase fold protein [Pararhizobium mangrovi]TPW25848.1 hypothetical protein FJU11_17470 [Pararhizobium mangrovi]
MSKEPQPAREAIEDPLDEIWRDDLLDRRLDAEHLLDFLVKRGRRRAESGKPGSYVLNLDADWGRGKSFFMSRLHEMIEKKSHPTVFVNAWKDDFADDPLTAVMAEFDAYMDAEFPQESNAGTDIRETYNSLKRNFLPAAGLLVKGAARRMASKAVGEGLDEAWSLIASDNSDEQSRGENSSQAEDLEWNAEEYVNAAGQGIGNALGKLIDQTARLEIAEFRASKASLTTFRNSLARFLSALEHNGHKKLPFFVLVDELDRCRPTYAISMLERIKHLFNVPNVVFVLATDTRELAAAIGAVYGPSFSSRLYLQRFFDQSYVLPEPSTERLVEFALEESEVDLRKVHSPLKGQDHVEFMAGFADHYSLTLREIERSIDVLASVTLSWQHPFPIENVAMFPLIVAYVRNLDLKSFWAGGSPVREMLKHPSDKEWQRHQMINGQLGRTEGNVNLVDFMIKVLDRGNQNLRKIQEEMPRVDPFQNRTLVKDIVLRQVFEREERGLNRGSDILTVIASYPKFIKRAGRFVSPGHKVN